jgi:antitoxin (DNA-binding transcriptional repressor) of toxin-antitoxin stability system
MKKVSMHNLKQELASYVGEAADGAEIMITRHNKPIARLSHPGSEHVHQGARFGKANLKPAVRVKTAGRYLQMLQDDRRLSEGK